MKNIFKAAGILILALISIKLVNVALLVISSPSDFGVAGGIFGLIVLVVFWTWLIRKMIKSQSSGGTASVNRTAIVGVIFLSTMVAGGCTRVNPGHAGIQVDLYGKNRGVQDYPLVTGMVWYNPISTDVLEYPIFVQTAIWTKDPKEGSSNNEEITFNSKEGLSISGDISLSYQLDRERVPAFYVKFRSDDLNSFTHGFLRNIARDSFQEIASRYDVGELYGPKKEEFIATVRTRINSQVKDIGVEIQQFGFIGAMRLPSGVEQALNAKIQATQDAIKAENQVRQAKAEADKTVATAEGAAKANEILTRSLNPTLIQWEQLQIQKKSVEKWNGALPQFAGGGTMPFIQLPTK